MSKPIKVKKFTYFHITNSKLYVYEHNDFKKQTNLPIRHCHVPKCYLHRDASTALKPDQA